MAARASVRPSVAAYAVGNALGMSAREVNEGLFAGRSGLRPCDLGQPFETACGVLPARLEPLPRTLAAFDTRIARLCVAVLDGIRPAVDRAVRRWGPDRLAVVLGTSTGGILESEIAFRRFILEGALPPTFDFDRHHSFEGFLEVVRRWAGAQGPGYVVSTACSSSGKVFGSAERLIACGIADAVLVGGADTLCQTTLRGFASLEALSRDPCRPFASDRDGTSLGEGAAFLLLERHGDGPAVLLGVGESSDAHHMSHPHPEGLGARLAMAEALSRAGVEASQVDHVNAHGTGTPINDLIEGRAIASLLGPRVPVVSTKGYTGHLLGAAGATEAVFAVMALERGEIPASLGAERADPAIPVRIARAPERRAMATVLSNSFGFGGNNVAILLGASR